MGTITLSLPSAGTVVAAGLHSANYSTLQTVINGGLDNNNFAAGKIFDNTKIMQGGALAGQALVWNGGTSLWTPTSGMVLAADSTLGVAAASFDFTGLPTTYGHLLIECYLRGDTAATSTTALVRFNNDAAANYDWQSMAGSGAAAGAGESFAASSFAIGVSPANTAGANLFSHHTIRIPNYGATANNKAATANCATKYGTTTGTLESKQVAGFWRSSAAINRITILPLAGNWVAGSRCSIYVMGS